MSEKSDLLKYIKLPSEKKLSPKSLKIKKDFVVEELNKQDEINFNPNSKTPINNINICIVGCVSAGKSTILNALFRQDFAQAKIKRTTMVPTVFVEVNDGDESAREQEDISSKIIEVNKEVIKLTEENKNLDLSKYQSSMIFHVNKLDVKISDNLLITLYDMPGLNDARTKDIYYRYLQENFYKFNIVIFVVDIYSGLNTSDEIDIVNLLTRNIKKIKSEENKNIHVLTVINKADDMQISDGELVITGELEEMFNQVVDTIKQSFEAKSISDNLIGFVPICGLDAHLYRMIQKFGPDYNLSNENILKIGTNDMGKKRFTMLKPQEQKDKVLSIIKDTEFIDHMIRLSGFEKLEFMLNEFIKFNGSSLVIDNINYELKRTDTVNIENLAPSLLENINLFEMLKQIDESKYNEKMGWIVKVIHTQVFKLISSTPKINYIIEYYNNVIKILESNQLICSHMEKFWNFEQYPSYFVNRIVELVSLDLSENIITFEKFKYFEILEQINYLNKETIQIILDNIINNVRGVKTINLQINFDTSKPIFKIFEKIKIADNFIQFIRFFIINQINSKTIDDSDIILKFMIYKQNNEIPLSSYISYYVNMNIDINKHIGIFTQGICPDLMNRESLLIDNYYIQLLQTNTN
jgi:GTPase SAR1 family protein